MGIIGNKDISIYFFFPTNGMIKSIHPTRKATLPIRYQLSLACIAEKMKNPEQIRKSIQPARLNLYSILLQIIQ